MRFIGARTDDWHSGNPNVRPGVWIGSFAGVIVLFILIAAVIGALVNGKGSPFLG